MLREHADGRGFVRGFDRDGLFLRGEPVVLHGQGLVEIGAGERFQRGVRVILAELRDEVAFFREEFAVEPDERVHAVDVFVVAVVHAFGGKTRPDVRERLQVIEVDVVEGAAVASADQAVGDGEEFVGLRPPRPAGREHQDVGPAQEQIEVRAHETPARAVGPAPQEEVREREFAALTAGREQERREDVAVVERERAESLRQGAFGGHGAVFPGLTANRNGVWPAMGSPPADL